MAEHDTTVLEVKDPVFKRTVLYYLASGIFIILLMMVMGLAMLLAQGKVVTIKPDFFYEIMTLHGTGMIGASALAASGIMWYFLRQYVKLSNGIFITNLFFFLFGVLFVIAGIFPFKFGGGWTFLYPLSSIAAGAWGSTGSGLYLLGMIVIGVGFLLMYLDAGRAIIQRYGSLGNALGWPQIFGKVQGYGPPGAVVASTMVVIANTVGLIAGATVLLMNFINVLYPSVKFDPLIAKNLTYAFGHIFANIVIYMGVIAVYEILPRYTNRPWKSNRVFLIAWNASTLFTIIIYPHHLLMDFAMPKWALILGQILSYANGFPVLVVTAYGALMLVYRSGIKWDIPSGLMFLSMFGWVAGVVPAVIDATIVINGVMHNTKWVPGHFHMYMGIGALSMIFGFVYFFNKKEADQRGHILDWFGFWVYGLFFMGLCGSFLFSGKMSVPRRWAVHFEQWAPYDQLGAFFAILIILSVFLFLARFLTSIKKMRFETHA